MCFRDLLPKVKTFQEIRNIYMKLKLLYPESRHIACAYIIPGEIQFCSDYQDDGEPGAGRALLQILKDNKLENQVVFVIRRYGGTRLGATRFSCYKQAALESLGIDPTTQMKTPVGNADFDQSAVPQLRGNPARRPYYPRRNYRGRGGYRGRAANVRGQYEQGTYRTSTSNSNPVRGNTAIRQPRQSTQSNLRGDRYSQYFGAERGSRETFSSNPTNQELMDMFRKMSQFMPLMNEQLNTDNRFKFSQPTAVSVNDQWSDLN